MIKNKFINLSRTNKTGFIPYLVAGHPNNKVFSEALYMLAELGADLIEIGIPFSDPIAEGKIIENAHHNTLDQGFILEETCEIVQDFKKQFNTPVIAMGYTNSFINPNSEDVSKLLANHGFNGVLIVDLPSSETKIIKSFQIQNLEIIQLVAPTTKETSIKNYLLTEPALIYYITQRGITGASNLNIKEISTKLCALKALTETPVVTGFGIKTVEHVKELKPFTDGIVIGSPIVEKIANDLTLKELNNYLKPLVDAIKT